MRIKLLLSLLILLLLCCSTTAQDTSSFKLIGNYQWVKKKVIANPEKLNYTTLDCPAQNQIIPKQSSKINKTKFAFKAKVITTDFVFPKVENITFKSKAITYTRKVAAPAFMFKDNSQFNVTYIDKAHGFVANSVSAVVEDNEHNVWIATGDMGLVKYDGLFYYVYDKNSGIISNTINHLKFDSFGALWLTTDVGIQFVKNDSVFEPQFKTLNNADLHGVCVDIDNNQNVWVSTRNSGVFNFNSKNRTVQHFYSGNVLPEDNMNDVWIDKQGNYWFAGLNLFKLEGKKLTMYANSSGNFNGNEYLKILEDNDTLWIGTFDYGIIKLTPTDTIAYSIYKNPSGRVFDIIKVKDALWFTLYGGGVCYLKGDDYLVLNNTNGLSSSDCS